MKLLRSFQALTMIVVLLSIAGLCAAQRSLGVFLIAGTLAAVSWYITEGPRGRTLPRWVSNLLVIFASLHVFVDLFQTTAYSNDVLGVLGRFAVWLTLIKLYERRTARDHAHLLVLSLLLMMTGCLQTNDLWFGVILVVYGVLGLYALLLYQLHAAYEAARTLRQQAIPRGYSLAPSLRPVTGRRPALHFGILAAGVGLGCLALSLLVFVAFPREVGAEMFGAIRFPTPLRVSKFNPWVDLMAGGRISSSRAKVMTVHVTDLNGNEWPQASSDAFASGGSPLLLRGATMDLYEGRGRWRPREGRVRTIMGAATASVPVMPGASTVPEGTLVQHVVLTRAQAGAGPLFSMYAPLTVSADIDAPLSYDPFRQIIRASPGTARLVGYDVLAHPSPPDEVLELVADQQRPVRPRTAWSQPDLSAVRELAERLLAERGISARQQRTPDESWKFNQQAADIFTRYLRSGQFTYTIDLRDSSPIGPAEDPIVWFLTRSRRGHCEFFASALTALCQSVAVPARMVVGYAAWEYDAAWHQYDVVEANAHAWVEVATDAYRWTTFDPTPAAAMRLAHTAPATLRDQVMWAMQRFEGDWSAGFVGYDAAAQERLVQGFNRSWTGRFGDLLHGARDWARSVNESFYLGPAGYIWLGIVGMALLIAAVAVAKIMRRTRAIRHAIKLEGGRGPAQRQLLRRLGFYPDMLDVLKRAGLAKPSWQPPLEFAGILSARRPEAGELVNSIAMAFYEGRFGGRRISRRQSEQARAQVSELARNLGVRA